MRFQAATQILTVNCAKMAEDRPKQAVHEFFCIYRENGCW